MGWNKKGIAVVNCIFWSKSQKCKIFKKYSLLLYEAKKSSS